MITGSAVGLDPTITPYHSRGDRHDLQPDHVIPAADLFGARHHQPRPVILATIADRPDQVFDPDRDHHRATTRQRGGSGPPAIQTRVVVPTGPAALRSGGGGIRGRGRVERHWTLLVARLDVRHLAFYRERPPEPGRHADTTARLTPAARDPGCRWPPVAGPASQDYSGAHPCGSAPITTATRMKTVAYQPDRLSHGRRSWPATPTGRVDHDGAATTGRSPTSLRRGHAGNL